MSILIVIYIYFFLDKTNRNILIITNKSISIFFKKVIQEFFVPL